MCNKSDLAVQCFSNGFNCAQSVFSSFCEELDLDKETALKISGAFGGGMGLTGEACGAVTGAYMVIGLKYGKSKSDDNAAKEKTYALVQEFSKRFKAEFGSVNCTELLKYDIGNEDEMRKAAEEGLFKSLCPRLVVRATELVEEIL